MPESRFAKLIEDLILFYLIITKVLEFFGQIHLLSFIGLHPGEVEFIDIIVSMTGLAYVLYRVSLSDIFFGKRNKKIDMILLIAYFFLIANKFVVFSRGSIEHTVLLQDFFSFIIDNMVLIEVIGATIGFFGILLLSIYVAIKVEIIPPSILSALHPEWKNVKKPTKFITVFFVLFGFHIIFFDYVSEWMTRVLDAPLVVIAIFLYVFKIHQIGKSMNTEMMLFKISDVVENSVEQFINLFHSKKTLFLGISMMLVLHLATDVGTFLIPYAIGTEPTSYSLGENHEPLKTLFFADKEVLQDKFSQVILFLVYVFNTLSVLFLMLFPIFIWFIIYVNHTQEKRLIMNFPDYLISLFFSLLVFLRFLPVYSFGSLEAENLLGFDIKTQSALASGNSLTLYFGVAIAVFFFIYVLTKISIIKDILFFVMTLVNLGFFGLYIYYFFNDFFLFYMEFISSLLTSEYFYISIFYMLFLLIKVVFYLGGYISFMISTFKSEN